METVDRGQELEPHIRRSAALWTQILAGRAPKGLGGLVRAFDLAQRWLVRRDLALPATRSAQRHRRRCLEVLQSENAKVEVLLARLAASTAELKLLADSQLASSREVLQAAPPVLKAWSWRDGARRLEFRFDVRSLRVVRRLFGMCWAATVRSVGGEVEIDTQPTGRESELIAAEVREWCASAAREDCGRREDSWTRSRGS